MKMILCLFSALVMCEVQSSSFFACFRKKKGNYTQVPTQQIGSDQNPLYDPHYKEPQTTTTAGTFSSSITTEKKQDLSSNDTLRATTSDKEETKKSEENFLDVKDFIAAIKVMETTEGSDEARSKAELHDSLKTHRRSPSAQASRSVTFADPQEPVVQES